MLEQARDRFSSLFGNGLVDIRRGGQLRGTVTFGYATV
jgi:hypothetical protein